MRMYLVLAWAWLFGGLLTGCTAIGPSAVRGGRPAYNEAVAETNRQQMLMAVVHNRYAEQGSLLTVSSITANVRFSAGTNLQLGLGDKDSYAGNLVPLAGSAVYEENPTISYAPVDGEKYLRRLMSPLPVALLARLAGSATDPAPVLTMLVAGVNDIRNPNFRFSTDAPDPRFQRFTALLAALARAGVLHWVDDPGHPGGFALFIGHYAPRHDAEVDELLRLLGLDAPSDPGASILIPITLGLGQGDTPTIALTTRSLFELVEILSAAIDLPPADRSRGLAQDYPPVGAVGSRLRIHWSDTRPEGASVAVRHRGGWFHIADHDLSTKGYFRMLGALWSVTIAESASGASTAPVLTVPVGR